ncbi:Undecaprenyl phosphate-alpha-4-amino-4-deoxy-L-arabinose arabinosyl transferase [Oligella ureolytica]
MGSSVVILSLNKKDVFFASLLFFVWIPMLWMPFQDTTEPRYAEIARLMLLSNDWITPWFEPGEPFWGKPPLSFWAAAASMKLFGVSEFAARLPSWIATLISVLAVRRSVSQVYNHAIGQWLSIIYLSMILVFVSAGAVMTDPFLALGTSLIFASYLVCMSVNTQANGLDELSKGRYRRWAYVGFIGLAVGLLAKGPLTLVIVGLPIAADLLWHRERWAHFLRVYPWGRGLLFVSLLVLPWYVAAEIKTPGFLNYFIVGEHFLRFVQPGWQGDLYGTAHREVYGTIWLNLLLAALPWWPIVLSAFFLLVRQQGWLRLAKRLKTHPMWRFVSAWALSSALLFTFSGNILWTYLLPSLIALALIFAVIMHEASKSMVWVRYSLWTAWALPVALSVVLVLGSVDSNIWKSEKSLVHFVQSQSPATLYYYNERPFSARFYSAEAVVKAGPEMIEAIVEELKTSYIAVKKSDLAMFNLYYGEHFSQVFKNKRYILMKKITFL